MKKIQEVVRIAKEKIVNSITTLIETFSKASTKKKLIAASLVGTSLVAVVLGVAVLAKVNAEKDKEPVTVESVLADGGDLIDANEELGIETGVEEAKSEAITTTNDKGEKVEVAQEVAKPDDPSTKTTVTTEQQNQNVANEPKQTQQPSTQQPSTPPPAPKPAAPSIATGYNANMTNAVMGIMKKMPVNNCDLYSQQNTSTPEFYNNFQSVASQYVNGSISDPSSAVSNRGDHYFQPTGETLYTVVEGFVFGEVTGNDSSSLASAMISKGCHYVGCINLSVSYNGSTYVCRFVYANTFVTSD